MRLEKISGLAGKALSSTASLLKVAIMSRGASPSSKEGEGKEIIILGNGPSLRETIEEDFDWLVTHDLMAVNFAAITPEFFRLRPKFYILADNHFFNSLQSDSNVRKLWENFKLVSWEMTLFLPSGFKHLAAPLLLNCPAIKVKYFNLTPVEGFKFLTRFLIDKGLGMPRPRNVLVPALIVAIRSGYRKIYICGADHTWTKTLDVDSDNFVISVQPHFYADNEQEHRRVRETYKGLRLHDVLGSMVVAFRSYWEIADYAKRKNISIINATPGSMIDAFPKMKKPENKPFTEK